MTVPTPEHPYPEAEQALEIAQGMLAKIPREPGYGWHPYVEAGALAFGMLKTIMECPNCPGHFRVPVKKDGERWVVDHDPRCEYLTIACGHCNTLWTRNPGPLFAPSEQPEPKKRRKHAKK